MSIKNVWHIGILLNLPMEIFYKLVARNNVAILRTNDKLL